MRPLVVTLALVACSADAGPSGGAGGAGAEGGGGVGAGAQGGDGGAGGEFDCDVLGLPGVCMDTSQCALLELHHPTPGYCPGPAEIQCCIPHGLAVCDPAVPSLPNDGNTLEAPGLGGCPDGMVSVDDATLGAFCVDRYEASLVTLGGDSFSPFLSPGLTPVRAVSVAGAVPQGYIDGVTAGDACTEAGKRLCTDAEWLRACRGPADTTYPYGDTLAEGTCNDHRALHPAIEYFGTSEAWIYSEIDNACINQLPESVAPTGSFAGCVTVEGALDMMGNLHEWTADPDGTFRGGFYVDTVVNGPGCLYATTAHDPSHWDYSTGFRCCADL